MVVEILQFATVFCVLPEWVYFRGQQEGFGEGKKGRRKGGGKKEKSKCMNQRFPL